MSLVSVLALAYTGKAAPYLAASASFASTFLRTNDLKAGTTAAGVAALVTYVADAALEHLRTYNWINLQLNKLPSNLVTAAVLHTTKAAFLATLVNLAPPVRGNQYKTDVYMSAAATAAFGLMQLVEAASKAGNPKK